MVLQFAEGINRLPDLGIFNVGLQKIASAVLRPLGGSAFFLEDLFFKQLGVAWKTRECGSSLREYSV